MSCIARTLLLLLALATLAACGRYAEQAIERADAALMLMVSADAGDDERDEFSAPGNAVDDDGERHIGAVPAAAPALRDSGRERLAALVLRPPASPPHRPPTQLS